MCDCTVLTLLRQLCRRRACSSDEQVDEIEMTECEYTEIGILIWKKQWRTGCRVDRDLSRLAGEKSEIDLFHEKIRKCYYFTIY